MKPRIVFITPPSLFLMDERVFVALGILKVAAVAEQLGYPVEHLDMNGVENYLDVVSDYVSHTSARIFALTATTPQMPAVERIAARIRSLRPDAKLILGGPHPTLLYAALRSGRRASYAWLRLRRCFNTIVAGDGEDAIERAIETSGLINADDPKGSYFLSSSRLAQLPLPARHLVDLGSYHYTIDNVPVTGLISQLGCPFGCHFCAGRDSAMLRRVRLRPTEHVLQELRHLVEHYNMRGFMFFDDELNVNRQLISLLQGMDDLQWRLGVDFRCRGFVKAELFTPEQAEWMYRVGFRRILCGFESGSPRILKNINKQATLDDNTRAMEIAHKYGLEMKALMSIGHPGESVETIEDTILWLLRVRPADFDATIITTYPGSPYYDRATPHTVPGVWKFETNGDRLYSYDVDYAEVEDYYKGTPGEYKSYVYTDYLSAEDLVALREYVERMVREKLQIPYYSSRAAVLYEHSMGQLPPFIWRASA